MPAAADRPDPEPAVVLPVRVRRRPLPEADPPYDDTPPDVSGALALAPDPAPDEAPFPRRTAARTLRLVPAGVPPAAAPGSVAAHAARLARAVLEVVAGDRPVAQLERWVTPRVYDQLAGLAHRRTDRPWAATLRRLRVCEVSTGVVEVAAVVDRGGRAAAMALRFEGDQGKWLLSAMEFG